MLWFGMVLSMGGFQMQMVARGILVYEMTGDPFITGLVVVPTDVVYSLDAGTAPPIPPCGRRRL